MSLYQKYRPKDFDSLYWQEFVKTSLKNALKEWKTVWAYLFYGSRWTGKTTVARILAKGFNCLNLREDGNPCLECANCEAFESQEFIDVIEIDAASNTWVDNIRELIEKAQFQPNFSKYKVYIIDEVHMLSKWAFNALLKTLEEPPAHVKFILATTEIHKIPDTIISRTQRYDFKKISENDIIERLRFIAKSEEINVEDAALKLIARLSRWWLRDAIAFFEQYSIWGELKLSYLMDNLQLVWDEFLERLIATLKNKDRQKLLEDLEFLKDKWIDVKIFVEEATFFLHQKIMENLDSADHAFQMKLYDTFVDMYSKIRFVPNTFMLLELWLLKSISWNSTEEGKTQIEMKQVEKKIEKKVQEIKEKEDSVAKEGKPEVAEMKKVEEKPVKEPKTEKGNAIDQAERKKIDFDFSKFIESIRTDAGKWFIAMSLKASEFKLMPWKIVFFANNNFNLEKLSTSETKHYIRNKIIEIFWEDVDVEVLLIWDKIKEDAYSSALDVF